MLNLIPALVARLDFMFNALRLYQILDTGFLNINANIY